MGIGILLNIGASESSKLFKYTVDNYSLLSSLVNVEDGDIANVKNSTGIFPRRYKGLWQYNSNVWEYANQELQDQLITHQAEIDANESAIQSNDTDITDLYAVKLEKGGYGGTAQDLKNDIDNVATNMTEAFTSFIPTQANSWHNFDTGIIDKKITISCYSTKNDRYAGVREENSLLDRRKLLSKRSSLDLKVNTGSTGVIEIYAQDIAQVSFTITAIE